MQQDKPTRDLLNKLIEQQVAVKVKTMVEGKLQAHLDETRKATVSGAASERLVERTIWTAKFDDLAAKMSRVEGRTLALETAPANAASRSTTAEINEAVNELREQLIRVTSNTQEVTDAVVAFRQTVQQKFSKWSDRRKRIAARFQKLEAVAQPTSAPPQGNQDDSLDHASVVGLILVYLTSYAANRDGRRILSCARLLQLVAPTEKKQAIRDLGALVAGLDDDDLPKRVHWDALLAQTKLCLPPDLVLLLEEHAKFAQDDIEVEGKRLVIGINPGNVEVADVGLDTAMLDPSSGQRPRRFQEPPQEQLESNATGDGAANSEEKSGSSKDRAKQVQSLGKRIRAMTKQAASDTDSGSEDEKKSKKKSRKKDCSSEESSDSDSACMSTFQRLKAQSAKANKQRNGE